MSSGYAPSFRLDGRVALVTGAGRGLGEHIALALAASGATLVLVGRDAASLATTAEAIAAIGGSALAVAADITRLEDVDRMVTRAVEAHGRIDVLVNNAGTNIQQSAFDVTEEAWDAVLDVNLKATFFVSQRVGREMAAGERGGGSSRSRRRWARWASTNAPPTAPARARWCS